MQDDTAPQQFQVSGSPNQPSFRTPTRRMTSGQSPVPPKHRWLAPVITLLIVALISGAGYGFFAYRKGYTIRTFTANDITFRVRINRNASTVAAGTKLYVNGTDAQGHDFLLYIAKAIDTTTDCHAVSGGSLTVIATPVIDGATHNLCYSQSMNLYGINFKHNGDWYSVALFPSVKTNKLDQQTIKDVAASIVVN
jgi:hypothetical protein